MALHFDVSTVDSGASSVSINNSALSEPASTGRVTNNDRAENINSPETIPYNRDELYEADLVDYTNYTADEENIASFVKNFKVTSLYGIEGIPYQFLPSVDRRVDGNKATKDVSDNISLVGRKYTEKIVTQIPLLFLVPCNPVLMAERSFNAADKNLMVSAMAGNVIDGLDELLKGSGRFYSAEYAHTQYYNYLNAMLRCVAVFLGIENEEIYIKGKSQKIGEINWADEIADQTGLAFKSKKNLIFYMDSIDSISESFANSTMQSSIAGLINGFSEQAKEFDFFFGSHGSNLVSSLGNSITEGVSSISTAIAEKVVKGLGGDIVSTVLGDGVKSIVDGGKIVFPEMWNDSSFDRSYSLGIKLRSPDNDKLSIFLNVLKPYCKILCLTLPHMIDDNVNTYRTPFLCKGYCKGLFNVELGMITGLSVTKGATCAWNDDGLPTQIDLEIDLKDMYSSLTMTGYEKDSNFNQSLIKGIITATKEAVKQNYNIVNNTAYMDFLANMSGLNVNSMEIERKAYLYWDLFKSRVVNYGSEVLSSRITDEFYNIMSRIYSRFG